MEITIVYKKDLWQLRDAVPDELLDNCSLCVAALDGDELKGVLTAQAVLSGTWDITYIYVDEAVRRQGVAKAMLELLTQTAGMLGAGALTLSYVKSDKDDSLGEFTRTVGFTVVRENMVLETTLTAAAISLDAWRRSGGFKGKLIPLKNVSNGMWNQFIKLLSEKRARLKPGQDNQVFIIPGDIKGYQGDTSFIAVTSTGENCGCILVRQVDDYVSVEYLCNLNESNPMVLLDMLIRSCDAAEENFGEIKICFHTYNPKAEKMARTLLGKRIKNLGRVSYAIRYI